MIKSGEYKELKLKMAVCSRGTIYIIFVVLTCILVALQILSYSGAEIGDGKVFPDSALNVSGNYTTKITPADWGFNIWILIHIWQVAWLAYGLSTLCRKFRGEPLYLNPGHMPLNLYILTCVASICYITWLLVWTRGYLVASLVLLILIAGPLYGSLWVSTKALKEHGRELIAEGMRFEVWLVRVLVQNGVATYATWVTVSLMVNLAVVLQYNNNQDPSVASTIGLCILTLIIIAWFILDNFFWDEYVRYIITPYIVVIWAFAAILDKNYVKDEGVSSFVAFLMALVLCGTAVKMIIMGYRAFRKPLLGGPHRYGLLSTDEEQNYGSMHDQEAENVEN